MERKYLFGVTKGTSYMGLTSGAAVAKESGLVYSRIALVKTKYSIAFLVLALSFFSVNL